MLIMMIIMLQYIDVVGSFTSGKQQKPELNLKTWPSPPRTIFPVKINKIIWADADGNETMLESQA